MEEWGKIEEWNTSENDKGSDFELLQKAVLVKKKNDDLHTARAKALSELCFLPAEGEQWRIITHKQFNAYAHILLQISLIRQKNQRNGQKTYAIIVQHIVDVMSYTYIIMQRFLVCALQKL